MLSAITSFIKKMCERLGFEIRKVPPVPDSLAYTWVRPNATYSPWNKDSAFKKIYATIQLYTLVDELRCYELWHLVQQSTKLDKGSIIEIGVWRGGTGILIAERAKRVGISEKVYLCDTFSGVVKAGAFDSMYKGSEHSDTSREVVEKLIDKEKLDNVEILEGVFPNQTGQTVEHLQFRFCHIDVDVYQSAKDIMEWIWPKMVRGGIVVYDDYGFCSCDGVTKCVEEQFLLKDRIIIHNLNGHAVVIKT
jgi:O-methyltransferase